MNLTVREFCEKKIPILFHSCSLIPTPIPVASTLAQWLPFPWDSRWSHGNSHVIIIIIIIIKL